ncbi:TPA: glycoside hydrolase family 99-like domain-containing protein [Streptococcus suis]|nr:glycoside hydrolase family 99-like domain-containing protein [Streptococcus suis]
MTDNNRAIYAIYLPQFHQIPENDEWWGQGFTEWDNVKKAKKLFNRHQQPQVPLKGYYDLSKIDSLRIQKKLIDRAGIDGFCFYHYYSNGKLLLEKPSENLLNNLDINIKFFFSWANHDWRRTWYSFNNEILFRQEYGTDDQIRQHYEYLRSFFLDDRYQKYNNKPIFVIYRSDLIPNFSQYKKIWDDLAQKDGFDGIYFISTITGKGLDKSATEYDAYFCFEPDSIISEQLPMLLKYYQSLRAKIVPRLNKILPWKMLRQVFRYENLMNISEKKEIDFQGKSYVQGAFARWDNTPRHSFNGRIISSPNDDYLKKVISKKLGNPDSQALPFIIVNSWNEWSEGSNIEPNIEDGYRILDIFNEVKND